MNINEIRMTAANAGSSTINISGNDLLSILNSIPAPASGSQWDDVTGGIDYAGGFVGINNAAPTVALDVVGGMLIEGSGTNDIFLQSGVTGFRAIPSDAVSQIGDISSISNGSIVTVDDNLNKCYADNNDHTLKFGINKTSPTVALDVIGNVKISSMLSINGLTDYANNAAAITGGLSTGDLYYTNSGGSAVIKIVV